MKAIDEFSDERHKTWCLHCGKVLAQSPTNRDHVPSKVLLDRPLPANLPLVEICVACNSGHSIDEEYFVAFLGAVLSGHTQPQNQVLERAGAVFRHNPGLGARIESARSVVEEGGENRVYWQPEADRIRRVVLKNARGHVYYEFGEPMLDEPAFLWTIPLGSLNDQDRERFETVVDETGISLAAWPEVGSRAMNRLVLGADLEDGWILVQEGVYRYAVIQDGGGIVVRIVIREYLAAEVAWGV